MALVKCKECNNEVSTDAKTCPKCGAKVKKRTSIATWLLGAVVLYTIVMSATNQSTSTPPSTPKTQEQKAADAKRDAKLQLAGMGALTLKKAMKDPEAFSFTSVVVKENGAACYEYRAKNGFGAIFPGSAILTSKGKLLVGEHDGNAFSSAWNKECTVNGGDDITELIKRLGIA